MEAQQKKRVLSLIQPTGTFTLGNYLGALKNFVALQGRLRGASTAWRTCTPSPCGRSPRPCGKTCWKATP